MKRILMTVALMMGLSATQINAQTVTGGIKVEGNMSNFILKDIDAESKIGFGVTAGGYGKIEFSENFALQPEVLLHFKNSEMENEMTNNTVDFQYFGVEVPIYAVGYTKLGNGKGFLGVGPYMGFGIDAIYKSDGASDVDLYEDNIMQRWDLGAGATLGYEFENKLKISAGYKMGFINALDEDESDASMLNQTISVGLGYRF